MSGHVRFMVLWQSQGVWRFPCVGIRGSGGMDGVLLVREWRGVHSCAGWRCEVRDLRAGVVEDGWWKELVGD